MFWEQIPDLEPVITQRLHPMLRGFQHFSSNGLPRDGICVEVSSLHIGVAAASVDISTHNGFAITVVVRNDWRDSSI